MGGGDCLPQNIYEITEFLILYFKIPTKFPKLGKFKRFNCSSNIYTFMMISHIFGLYPTTGYPAGARWILNVISSRIPYILPKSNTEHLYM